MQAMHAFGNQKKSLNHELLYDIFEHFKDKFRCNLSV